MVRAHALLSALVLGFAVGLPRLAVAQFTIFSDGGLRKPGDVPDEAIYAEASRFLTAHGRQGIPLQATMELRETKFRPRRWEVSFEDRVLVEIEPTSGRVVEYSDLEYFWSLPGGRHSSQFRYRSAEDARADASTMLLALTAPVVPMVGEVQFAPEGGKHRTAIYAYGSLLEDGVPVRSVSTSIGMDPETGKLVSFTGFTTFAFENRESRLSEVEAQAVALSAYATMRVLGERCQYDPKKPPEKIYTKPRSQYGLAYPPTEEVVRLRLAWRVRFGHHVVDVDAATGQILGESLGKQ
ncbi:MAG: hypothetical protein IT207_10370 [Fimbriimonadaceae bacterium]|nr:hypothetical protein [Fimbriimonadaceae bacterium]